MAEAPGNPAWPARLTFKAGARHLEIVFDDGETFAIPYQLLRVESPSAEVQGHAPDQKKLVSGKRDIDIVKAEPVGRYAVRLTFSDGHDSGIYSWDYLRQLGEDPAIGRQVAIKVFKPKDENLIAFATSSTSATTTEAPDFAAVEYNARGPFESIRAYRDDVEGAIERGIPLVDVRSPEEFRGEILAPPGLQETAQRGGHVPGAKNISWAAVTNDDGTFKTREELAATRRTVAELALEHGYRYTPRLHVDLWNDAPET